MTGFNKNQLARLQFFAVGQGIFKTGGGETALQPIEKHGFLPRIIESKQVGQARQRGWHCGPRCQRRAVKRQLGGRCIIAKGSHHVQARHFQRTQALAQRPFQGIFPTLFDVYAAPQTRQGLQPVPGQPGL